MLADPVESPSGSLSDALLLEQEVRNLDGDRGYVCFTALPRTLKSAARLSACLLHRVTSKLGEPPRVREKLLSSLWQVRALRPAAPACVEYCQQGTDSEVRMVWEGVAGGVPEPHGECHMPNNGMWQMLQAAHLDGRNVARRDLKHETLMFARHNFFEIRPHSFGLPLACLRLECSLSS